MRQLLIPLLIAVLATIAALLVAVPPHAHAHPSGALGSSSLTRAHALT